MSALLRESPEREIVQEMEESYLDYAMSVIVSRALPDIRDGLKPVHRRILYAMHKLGITSRAKFVKSARVVGEVIGKYHPHGDSAVYDSMVRMAQDFSLRAPLVRGQGNFGSIDGDPPAAMRYTEAKMEQISDELLADLEKETVDFRDNYDGSLEEPTVLPAKIPNLLLNGAMGIAVGMATNIPPHNLGELIDGLLHLSEHPDAEVGDLMEYIKGPDFPTSGTIYDVDVIRQAYASGRGSIIMRGKAEVEEVHGKYQIVITEIPYQVNKSVLVERIADLVREKIIQGVSNLTDESNRDGIRIVLELKKDAFPNKVLNVIYKHTPLQSSFGCNFIALGERGFQPRLFDLKSLLEEFILHRKEIITKRTKYDLKIAEARAHILEGLKKALDHIDAIITLIKASATKEIAKENLMKKFKFSDLQSDAILAMRLQTLAGLERKKIDNELKEKHDFIADCKDILAKPSRILKIMKTELLEIKEKYATPRKTEIIPHALGKFNAKDTIPNSRMLVTVTQNGSIKRMPASSYKTQSRGGKGLMGSLGNSEDEMQIVLFTQNHNDLMFFTSKGRVLMLPAYEIPEASRTAKGQNVINFLQLQENESITAILNFTESKNSYLFMCTKHGTVKKTKVEFFQNVRKSGIIAIHLKDNDALNWVNICSEGDEVMIVTKEGKGIRFKEDDVRPMGRTASGVRGIRLKANDEVVEMTLVQSGNEKLELLVVMENGLGKMTEVSEYRSQTRGGTGVKTANVTAKTGKVVGAKVLDPEIPSDLILTSTSGQAMRMSTRNIPSQGRATQGVILMRLPQAEVISSIALLPEKDEEGEKGSDTQESEDSAETSDT
ncbi:DNA gyrase subunit A [Candidatus Peregrinibacteria bacterium]|nr:DNA gyrase subunit A [Candidatus Peregrinibacteria bacterium]